MHVEDHRLHHHRQHLVGVLIQLLIRLLKSYFLQFTSSFLSRLFFDWLPLLIMEPKTMKMEPEYHGFTHSLKPSCHRFQIIPKYYLLAFFVFFTSLAVGVDLDAYAFH